MKEIYYKLVVFLIACTSFLYGNENEVRLNDLKLEISPFKSAIVLYEPLWMKVNLKNEGKEKIAFFCKTQWFVSNGMESIPVTPRSFEQHMLQEPKMRILSSQEVLEFADHIYGSSYYTECDPSLALPELSGCLERLPFPSPGSYKVWLEISAGHNNIRSNEIKIDVKPHYGVDERATLQYKYPATALALLMGRHYEWSRGINEMFERGETYEEVAQSRAKFLRDNPDSTYSPYVAASLCYLAIHQPVAIRDPSVRTSESDRARDTCAQLASQYLPELNQIMVQEFELLLIDAELRRKNFAEAERLINLFMTKYPRHYELLQLKRALSIPFAMETYVPHYMWNSK